MLRHAIIPISFAFTACTVTGDGKEDQTVDPTILDAIEYRDITSHPGCSKSGMSYSPASVENYNCAAMDVAFPAGVSEDTSKPIVVLVHGNSDVPASYFKFPVDTGIDQLGELLPAAGFRTYAIDLRVDLVDDPQGNNETENAARNIGHGWSVPLLEEFYVSLADQYPDRRFTFIGFSLGTTVIRDAMRRLHLREDFNPWGQIEDLVLLAGANHGVSSCSLCSTNPTMRGQVACEMGCRDNFSSTDFMASLNGADGVYETPCSDGQSAYGRDDACEGNAIDYTTVVMRDLPDGTYQDLFVSEASARLVGADNRLIALEDVDESGYFFDGLFKNHYGAARSEAALEIIMTKVQD